MEGTHDLSLLPTENARNGLVDIIENQFNLKNYSIHIESGSSKGDNYIGIVFRAIIKPIECTETTNNIDGKSNIGGMSKPISIMIKVPPQNAARREHFLARPAFLRESLVYDEIIPMYMKFQESKGIIPRENGFHEFAKCYKCLTDDFNEGIFLHDLGVDGFEMFSRFSFNSEDHVNLMMKTISKFHAIGYAIKDQYPEKMEPFKDIKDVFADREQDPQLLEYFNHLVQRTKDALSPENDKKLIDAVDNYFRDKEFMDILKDLVHGKNAEPYAIVCHGDCWNNNVLFKNKNGKPYDIRLIDWQVARYSSPVSDLMYYIFSSTSKELRDKNYFNFLDTYYTSLSNFLQRLGSDAEKVFPRKAFDDQVQRFGSFGFLMAMMLLPIISSEVEDIPDLDEIAEQLNKGELDTKTAFNSDKTNLVFKKKIWGVVTDSVRLGYL